MYNKVKIGDFYDFFRGILLIQRALLICGRKAVS